MTAAQQVDAPVRVGRGPGPNPDPASIEYWIPQLVSAADGDERLNVGVAACAALHAMTLVRCVRCWSSDLPAVPFPAMVRHVRQAEAELAALGPEDGPRAAIHGPTDIRPASSVMPFRPPGRRGGRR